MKKKLIIILLIFLMVIVYMFREPKTKNFKRSEFDCKDGTPVPPEYYSNLRLLMGNLEIIRSALGNKPIIINSGYRTIIHNYKVGGVANSYHLKAMASDIVVNGLTSLQVASKIKELIRSGKITAGGVGLYSNFVHYDIRGSFVEFYFDN